MASGAVRELITKVKFQIDKASLSQANKAAQDVKKNLTSVSDKSLKVGVMAETSKAQSALKDLKRQADKVSATVSKVKVNADTGNATSTLQRFKRTLNAMKANVNAKVNVDTGNANSVLARIKDQLKSIGSKVTTAYVDVKQKGKAVGEGVKKAGQALADNGGTIAATGAAMVAPLALPVNTAMDFEQAMSKVKAITNSTDDDMARLTQTARDLGANTQFSATEAAQAMSYLGMAGWKTEQIIAGMPGLLDLAAASGEDLARVSDIVSDDLTAFHMSADQAAHMADVMAAASTNANTNVSMMGETFKYAGGIAGSLGYSLEDVAIATGLMANAGIKGEMAGTALRSIMTRLVTPTGEASLALEQVGFSAKNADGSIKPFRDQLKELRAAMQNMTDSQKAEFAQTVAGTEAMTGFLDVINASDADFAKMAGAVDNSDGAAKNMADTMNANAKGSIKGFKSAMEDLSITIGNTFLGALTGVIKGVTNFARALGKFAQEHPKIVAGITAIIAIGGMALFVLGAIGLAISALGTAFGALAPLFAAVSGAIGGIMAIFSSWGTLFAGLFGGISAMATSFIGSISALFTGGLFGAITSTFGAIVSVISGAFSAVAGVVSAIFSPIGVAIMAIIGIILLLKNHWDEVVAWFAPGIESMQEGLAQLASAWENIQPLISAVMPLLERVATLLGGLIVGAVSLLFRAFMAAFNTIAGVINWVTDLVSGLAGVIGWVSDLLGGLIDKALNFIGLKSEIGGVNTSITQGWADAAMGGGGNTNTQNNTFNLAGGSQLFPAMQSSNSFFDAYS